MRRALAALALACALLLAACGGGRTLRLDAHACNTHDYFMQCALPHQRLLVSPRAIPVTAYGEDFGWGGPTCSSLRATGRAFGASYLSADPSKNWQVAQVHEYLAHNCALVMVWETVASRALDGRSAGQQDAARAAAQALAYGEPANRPIFFAVDFDETPGQAAAVAAYFGGVDSVLGTARTGAYGGYWVVKRLFDAGLIGFGWQTYAWSGGNWDPRAHLEQYLNDNVVDYDRATATDYGQWPTAPPPPPVCYSHREPQAQCAAVKARVAAWQHQQGVVAWQQWWVGAQQQHYRCRTTPPFRRSYCRWLAAQRATLAFDAAWLRGQIKTTIANN